MNRIGVILLNVAAALYLFANGIMGLNNQSGSRITRDDRSEFYTMVRTIFNKGDFPAVLIVILSVCAIVAGIFLLMKLFGIKIRITDTVLLAFIILWVVFIVIVDIVHPINNKITFLEYIRQLGPHLMVLGALLLSTERFGA